MKNHLNTSERKKKFLGNISRIKFYKLIINNQISWANQINFNDWTSAPRFVYSKNVLYNVIIASWSCNKKPTLHKIDRSHWCVDVFVHVCAKILSFSMYLLIIDNQLNGFQLNWIECNVNNDNRCTINYSTAPKPIWSTLFKPIHINGILYGGRFAVQLNQNCLQIVNMIARVQIDTHLINLNVISSRTNRLYYNLTVQSIRCGTQLQCKMSATKATTS